MRLHHLVLYRTVKLVRARDALRHIVIQPEP